MNRSRWILLSLVASAAAWCASAALAFEPVDPTPTDVDVFAILQLPSTSTTPTKLTFGYSAGVSHHAAVGSACAEIVRTRAYVAINGSLIGLRSSGVAVDLAYGSVVADSIITGGGSVMSRPAVRIDGRSVLPAVPIDVSGNAPAVGLCTDASAHAGARIAELSAAPANTGLRFGRMTVRRGQTLRLPASGTLGSGDIVIDADDVHVASFGTLALVGDASTQTVVVRINGSLRVGYGGSIALAGLSPTQVVFLVEGPITSKAHTRISGTLVGQSTIDLGYGTQVNGALLAGGDITLAQYAQVNFFPFSGW